MHFDGAQWPHLQSKHLMSIFTAVVTFAGPSGHAV